MVTSMILYGFSLLELRQLYIDELIEYDQALSYLLIKRGDIKSTKNSNIDKESFDDVSALRSQLFKVMKPKKT